MWWSMKILKLIYFVIYYYFTPIYIVENSYLNNAFVKDDNRPSVGALKWDHRIKTLQIKYHVQTKCTDIQLNIKNHVI